MISPDRVLDVLERQKRLQRRFHRLQGLWLLPLFAVGFVFSSMGLVAARILAHNAAPLSTRVVVLFGGGFLVFGWGVLAWLLPARWRPRIVPCFARQLGEYGGASTAAFRRGRGLYLQFDRLEELAGQIGVPPLSSFGFGDDYYGQTVTWHDVALGLRTIAALRDAVTQPGDADVRADLEALAAVLQIAQEAGVAFGLRLRLHRTESLQVVSSMEQRQGRFW